jgi:tetratricopeptide (TPR) repeat protein
VGQGGARAARSGEEGAAAGEREGRAVSRKVVRGALLASALAVAALAPGRSFAAPTIWAQVRQPELAERAALLEEADKFLLKLETERDPLGEPAAGVDVLRMGPVYLLEAQRLLEQAGGAKSPDPRVRLRLGYVLRRLGQDMPAPGAPRIELAVTALRSVVTSDAPPVLASIAWNELAICYALLGRRDEEIHAYGQALSLEPIGNHRAVLLANRAESLMAAGNLEEAIRGYREALRSLLPIEMFDHGVTALWGLAVALDRDGDLDAALASINLARAYDRDDQRIQSSSWFFSPPYDEAWYLALGFWSAARTTDQGAVRAAAYERTVEQWQSYLERAPKDDRYVPLARVRLRMCEKERDRALASARGR